MEDLENEIWKDVKNYEGNYQVSNFGRVRRISQKGKNRKGNRVWPVKYYLLKGTIGKIGYPLAALSKNGIVKICTIHRLVAEAFLDPVEFKADVNHKDNDRINNHISNLEFVSHRSNTTHGFKHLGRGTSKFVGVHWSTPRQRWAASIQVNGHSKFLGHFFVEEEAAKAYTDFIEKNNIINSYA